MGSSANPFAVPGYIGHGRPLVPWRNPEHADHYVDIDGMRQAFEAFQAFADWDSLQSSGSLVVVTGPPGCGKTSLINRCAHWLSQQARENSGRVFVVDLTVVDPNLTIGDRLTRITQRLVEAGRSQGFVNADFIENVRPLLDEPGRVFDQYSRYLQQENFVAVVLLPESELSRELDVFAHLAAPGLALFAESGFADISNAVPHATRQRRVLHLRVGTLKEGDATAYVRARLHGDGDPPSVNGIPMVVHSSALEMLVDVRGRVGTSIGFLQRLLAGLWDEAEQNPSRANMEITYERLADYLVRTLVLR